MTFCWKLVAARKTLSRYISGSVVCCCLQHAIAFPCAMQRATCPCIQVCSYLKSIDDGADGYNEAWDAWVDTQNLPVSHCMLVCICMCFSAVRRWPICYMHTDCAQVRTTIEAKLMRPDFLVEIDLIAAVL